MELASEQCIFGVKLVPDLARGKAQVLEPPGRQLVRLGHALLDTAKAHCMPAPALFPDPPTVLTALAALRDAATVLSQGTETEPARLWAGLAPLRSGEIRRSLLNERTARKSRQNILALVADAVDGPLLYLANQSPIRVSEPVAFERSVPGPYLVLALCDLTGHDRMTLVAAGAIAVFTASRLVPVASNLERDALRAMGHLQETLDASGVLCAVHRHPPVAADRDAHISLALSTGDHEPQTLRFAVGAPGQTSQPPSPGAETGLALNATNWRDGSFMAALAARLQILLAP